MERMQRHGVYKWCDSRLQKNDIKKAVVDGCTMVLNGENQQYVTMPSGNSKYVHSDAFRKLHLSTTVWRNVQYARKVKCVQKGHSYDAATMCLDRTHLTYVTSGAFNDIVRVEDEELNSHAKLLREAGGQLVLRMSRFDNTKLDSYDDDIYNDMDQAIDEAYLAMSASLMGVGVPVYLFASFDMPRRSRLFYYGSVYVMSAGDTDLSKYLFNCTAQQGRAAAAPATELLYSISAEWSPGYVFLDVKPSQIIVYHTDHTSHGKNMQLRLTDFDTRFFLECESSHWTALLLVNVVLLCAHVKNINTPGARAFINATLLLLDQLVNNTNSGVYNNIFMLTPACKVIDLPTIDEYSNIEAYDFLLQRIFASIAYEYFYNQERVRYDAPSLKYKWDTYDVLDYWKSGMGNNNTWPTQSNSPPLLMQLVDFVRS
jgi:hypothetical protein